MDSALNTAIAIMKAYISDGRYCNLYVSPYRKEVNLDVHVPTKEDMRAYDNVWYTERKQCYIHIISESTGYEISSYVDKFILTIEDGK